MGEMVKRVLVVGGGIGGLVLTRALARSGIGVDLIERAPELRAIGAGITLGANAMRVLASLEIGDAVAACGHGLSVGGLMDARGQRMSSAKVDDIEAKYGRAYAIDRATLHEVLAEGLTTCGRASGGSVDIRCGTTVTALEEVGDHAVDVVMSDGRAVRYRAVVGADGLRSSVRSLVFGSNEPIYAGYTSWRWVGHVPGGLTEFVEMWGYGQRVGLVPLGPETIYAFFVANAPPGTPNEPEQGTVEYLRKTFAGFAADVPRVLEAIANSDAPLLHHDIEEVDQRPWTSGAIALLGDAAHAMTPNFGQGAAMAIEDAIVLARELPAHPDAATAFAAYEARRRPRVDELQRGARRLGVVAQWESPLAAWARNWAIRRTPESTARRMFERIVAYVP